MKRRLFIGLAMVVACAFAWMAVSWYQTPRFKGKSVRTWINLASHGNPALSQPFENWDECCAGICSCAQKQDSRIHKFLWKFQIRLHPRLLRPLSKEAGPPIAWDERARAARALAAIGRMPDGPYLISLQALHDPKMKFVITAPMPWATWVRPPCLICRCLRGL